jgi:hypothetical protein
MCVADHWVGSKAHTPSKHMAATYVYVIQRTQQHPSSQPITHLGLEAVLIHPVRHAEANHTGSQCCCCGVVPQHASHLGPGGPPRLLLLLLLLGKHRARAGDAGAVLLLL